LTVPEQPGDESPEGTRRPVGRVHLVGAGPGDPGLLTARAIELIARADTILYDRLIPAEALEGARADAELLFVGKEGGGASVPQSETTALMIERAHLGREVVRLKGGDPFVFGRGGEEALALRDAGIEFGVVPGVTAGVAAAAYAGIPVTHRGISTAVALVTGHEDPTKAETELDWGALAAFPGTLVFYMGVRRLERIAGALVEAGRPAGEEVALVERGTLPDQRTVTGTLATIAEVGRRERVKAPAIAIVGPVAGLAESLDWRSPGPLSGVTVAVTRARAQSSGLAQRLTDLGATVVQAPTIRTRPLPGPALDPRPYDLVCLTSPNAVELLLERLDDGTHPRGDARALAGTRIAAIGPGTTRALQAHGILADMLPERSVAESLVEGLAGLDIRRALLARASEARDVLPDALRSRGIEVDVLALYETVAEPLSEQSLAAARAADYIAFTSASTVRYFLQAGEAAGGSSDPPFAATTRVASIGPVTSAALRERGLEPHIEAPSHDLDGLVEALLADVLAHPHKP
jgi:uroporphyrinogen III methyltransferase/synthase